MKRRKSRGRGDGGLGGDAGEPDTGRAGRAVRSPSQPDPKLFGRSGCRQLRSGSSEMPAREGRTRRSVSRSCTRSIPRTDGRACLRRDTTSSVAFSGRSSGSPQRGDGGHSLHFHGPRVPVPADHNGLGQPQGALLASVQYPGGRVLRSGSGGGLYHHGAREIFNTDQGAQPASSAFIHKPKAAKGRWIHDTLLERLWRASKYEEVYLKAHETVAQDYGGIGGGLDF